MVASLRTVARRYSSVVAVVGRGHLSGIAKHWKEDINVSNFLLVERGSFWTTRPLINSTLNCLLESLCWCRIYSTFRVRCCKNLDVQYFSTYCVWCPPSAGGRAAGTTCQDLPQQNLGLEHCSWGRWRGRLGRPSFATRIVLASLLNLKTFYVRSNCDHYSASVKLRMCFLEYLLPSSTLQTTINFRLKCHGYWVSPIQCWFQNVNMTFERIAQQWRF